MRPELVEEAGAEGFEPPHDGTKTRCLTAWRRPSVASRRIGFGAQTSIG